MSSTADSYGPSPLREAYRVFRAWEAVQRHTRPELLRRSAEAERTMLLTDDRRKQLDAARKGEG